MTTAISLLSENADQLYNRGNNGANLFFELRNDGHF